MMAQGERQKMTAILMCIFFTGIILRFFLAAVIPHAGDIDAWMHYSNYWEQGLYSPYNEVDRYKYSPFWFWIISLVSLICKAMGCPFFFAIRVPIIATDVVLFWLLLKCCKQLTFSSNRTLLTMALFFLNPISFQMSGFFGQFDNMSMLFILCAWYACTFQPKWHFGWTLAFINISLAIKHFTIMLVPVLAFAQQKWNRKVSVAIFSPALFFAILIPFWIHDTQWVNISVFQYNLGSGYWGWLGIICRSVLLITHYDIVNQPWFIHTSLINPLLYLAMLLGSFWIVKHYTLLDSLILLLLVFYALTTQMAPQYTVWILPLAVLRPNRYFYAYSIIAGVQLTLFYYSHYHWFYDYPLLGGVSETFVIFRYLTWIVCVLWLIDMLKLKKSLQIR